MTNGDAFSNPKAATNMTMIATVEGEGLKAYIGVRVKLLSARIKQKLYER